MAPNRQYIALEGTLTGSGPAVHGCGDGTTSPVVGTAAISYGDLPSMSIAVSNIVGTIPTSDGSGSLPVGSDGGIFAFSDGYKPGSLPAIGVHVNNIIGDTSTL